jgi:cytochrome c biogenesis protein ResB
MGDRATLETAGKLVGVAYQNQKQSLPFALSLDRFNIEYYPGSRDPKSYASKVSVRSRDGTPALQNVEISMNEPLHHEGITFYQASYEPGEPRPIVSIFSVNRDPGRQLKYWGSLLIVLGSAWLFWVKTRQARARARSLSPEVRS